MHPLILALDAQSGAYRAGSIAGYAIGIMLLFAVPALFIIALIFSIKTKRAGWIVGCALAGLATLGLGGIFIAGVVRGVTQGAELNRGIVRAGRPLFSADGLIRITPPAHWRELPGLNADAKVQAGNARREEYLIVLTDTKEEFSGTLAAHAQATTSHLMDSLEDATISEPESLTIGGLPALRSEIGGTVQGLDILYLHTTVAGALGFHQVLAWTLAPRRAQAWPSLLQAADSFQEISPAAPGALPSPTASSI